MWNEKNIDKFQQLGVELKNDLHCNECRKVIAKTKEKLYFGLRDRETGDMYFASSVKKILCCGISYDIPLIFSNIEEINEYIEDINASTKLTSDEHRHIFPSLHVRKLPVRIQPKN